MIEQIYEDIKAGFTGVIENVQGALPTKPWQRVLLIGAVVVAALWAIGAMRRRMDSAC